MSEVRVRRSPDPKSYSLTINGSIYFTGSYQRVRQLFNVVQEIYNQQDHDGERPVVSISIESTLGRKDGFLIV